MNRLDQRHEVNKPKTASEVAKKIGWSGLVELVNYINSTKKYADKWTVEKLDEVYQKAPLRFQMIALAYWRLKRKSEK